MHLSYDENKFVVSYIISTFIAEGGREGQGCPPPHPRHGGRALYCECQRMYSICLILKIYHVSIVLSDVRVSRRLIWWVITTGRRWFSLCSLSESVYRLLITLLTQRFIVFDSECVWNADYAHWAVIGLHYYIGHAHNHSHCVSRCVASNSEINIKIKINIKVNINIKIILELKLRLQLQYILKVNLISKFKLMFENWN